MSFYQRKKALRVPLAKYGYNYDTITKKFPELDDCKTDKIGLFEIEITSNYHTGKSYHYLDYIIDYEDDCECGDYTKARYLTENEKNKYCEKFQKYLPDIDMNDVHLVEYCYYNCSEPNDCYEINKDEFYEEV